MGDLIKYVVKSIHKKNNISTNKFNIRLNMNRTFYIIFKNTYSKNVEVNLVIN